MEVKLSSTKFGFQFEVGRVQDGGVARSGFGMGVKDGSALSTIFVTAVKLCKEILKKRESYEPL